MAMNSILDVVFTLFGFLSALLFVVAGVVALKAFKNLGSVILLVGALLSVCNAAGWLVFQFVQQFSAPDWSMAFITLMRVVGTTSWMMTGVGVLLLALSAAGLRRQNQTLEAIMEGSRNDRVA